MTEEFVTLETAKLLKEKGFKEDVFTFYEVDCVEEIEEVPDSKISLMPSVASNEDTAFMEQVLQIGNEIIITINVDKVLSEDVRQMVDQIVEENQ